MTHFNTEELIEPLANFYTKWGNCERCPLHQTRHSIALWKGYLPCDILFIGEAPGASEDAEGIPFSGPSGLLLEDLIRDTACEYELTQDYKDSTRRHSSEFTFAFTNTVCCYPRERWKSRPPTPEELTACQPRLTEFIALANPAAIVLLGMTAKSAVLISAECNVFHLYSMPHPSSLLQTSKHEFGPKYRQAVANLVPAFEYVGSL